MLDGNLRTTTPSGSYQTPHDIAEYSIKNVGRASLWKDTFECITRLLPEEGSGLR